MSDVTQEETGRRSRRRTLARWAPALVLLIAVIVVSAFVIPDMKADGSARTRGYDLDASVQTPGLRTSGAIRLNVYGFVLAPHGRGRASFGIAAALPRPGERTVLLISGDGGTDAPTRVALVDGSGTSHPLGTADRWQDHRVDVTGLLPGDRGRIVFAAANSGSTPRLIADRVTVVVYPPGAAPTANRWAVAAWLGLIVLFVLALLRRIRRDWMLAVAASLTGYLVWPSVLKGALQPPASDPWTAATHAKWLDLDHGLLSGTFGGLSSLTVQLYHALSPIAGTGAAGARTAGMLVGVLAIAAIYALGRRVAGPVGAVTAVTFALLTDAFRLSLTTGDSTATLVLASTLFLLSVHRVLARSDVEGMALLGGAGALAVLAEPTWWPGVLAGFVLLAVRHVPEGSRRRALVVAVAAFALVSLPSRVSVAHQSGGDLTADATLRTTFARNHEFVGRGHSAPPDPAALAADPYGGEQVGLGSYVFGDHTLSVVAGGTLSGAYDGLSATADRPDTKLIGLLAFLVELVGAVFLLLLPRLRLLVLIPAMVALVPWFLTSRGSFPPFVAETAFWPALLVGASTVVYVAWGAVRERVPRVRLPATAATRLASLRRSRSRSPQPG
jgi:hypothetical protein